MTKAILMGLSWVVLSGSLPLAGRTQVLTLKQAVQTALTNYGAIRAKTDYVKAAQAGVKETKMEYLPDLNISAQQVYGTVNSQYGPLAPYKVAGVGSSGPVFATQNWNAAFGALYLSSVNWDFFQFGRAREKTRVAQTVLGQNLSDLDQERFQQSIKVSAAYLNVLAAQRLIVSQRNNLERATAFRTVAVARAKTGLNPGVDSSLANAEVSNARIVLTNAIEYEQEQATQLAQLMQVAPRVDWVLDSLFVTRIPASLTNPPAQPLAEHPVLKFFQQRINVSNQEVKYLRSFNYPTFSMIGVLQDRGSGFPAGYGQNSEGYTSNYFKGVSFDRGNFLLGVGFVWNLTNPLRVHQQVVSQHYISQGLQEEYGVINQELQAQLVLSEAKIKNALDNYHEAPIQVKAASDAYVQKETLYRNGLATIVDVTTAAFLLNQAETELDIADNNVWQALLYKAASSGDFGLFYNEF